MQILPQDPMILLSFINMKLRNEYSSLHDLCLSLNISQEQLCQDLKAAGFQYRQDVNQFR